MKTKHKLVVTKQQILVLRRKYPSFNLESHGNSRAWSEGSLLMQYQDSKKYTELVMKLENCGFIVDEE